jgi:hypothetical protein
MALTPEQFNRIVLREELHDVKDDIKELKDDMKKVLKMLDKTAKSQKDHDIEHVANIGAHDRFQTKIDSHESRRKKLEAVGA